MKLLRTAASGLLLGVAAAPASAATIVVNSIADNGPGNCSSVCTLRDAIAGAIAGDSIEFGASVRGTIVLNGTELPIATPLSIVGPGAGELSISANNQSRVFNVSAAATISGLTLRDGSVTGAVGSVGGPGQPGQGGGTARGACVYVSSAGTLTIARSAVFSCAATGGLGGTGGQGMVSISSGSRGGTGGGGGAAFGAVFSSGELSIVQSSVTGCTLTGGAGGTGGNYGARIGERYYNAGTGGVGGQAEGGVYVSTGSVLVSNSTLGSCVLTGGVGGSAGLGTLGYTGIPGKGGRAAAGSLFVGGDAAQVGVEFSTLTGNTVSGGVGGSYPSLGPSGTVSTDAFYSAIQSDMSASIVASTSAKPDCAGTGSLVAHGANFDHNSTCGGFTLHGSAAQSLGSLSAGADATLSYMPTYGSTLIDAASTCTLLDNSTLTDDQHGTTRPQGLACDLGAIEADYIFVNGFE